MPEKHELDQKAEELLDRALARYAGEPLAGLENRTLARLRAAEETAATRFFSKAKWTRRVAAMTAAAAAVAASLVIGIQIGQHRADAVWQQRVANGVWNSVRPTGTVMVPPAPVVARASMPRKHVRPSSESKLTSSAQFPSPTPLSSQERALARLAATTDPAALASLAQSMHAAMTNENPERTGPPQ
jgi:hypothetical protein